MNEEEKPKKRPGPGGITVSGPRDISGEIPLGMPAPKGKPTPDFMPPEVKKAVKKGEK